ncbi:MAG: GTP-binding protein [Promethearchaeota archaeon]
MIKISIDRKKLEALLKWYASALDDLESVVIVDRDGLPIASYSKKADSVDEEVIGGLSAVVEPILKRITGEFQAGAFGAGAFDTESNRLVFVEAGPTAILVSICSVFASIDSIYPYAYLAAEKLARIFDGRIVSPVIPKITQQGGGNPTTIQKGVLTKLEPSAGNYAYKIILGGDGGVGKTTLVTTFVQGKMEKDYKATIGASIMKQECKIRGTDTTIRMVIWDLAGQAQFKRVRSMYFQNAEAGLIIFDVTRRETFESVKRWHQEAVQFGKQGISLMMIGNKIDLEDSRQVTFEEAKALADELGLSYIETSAFDSDLVQEAFEMLAFLTVNKKGLQQKAL